MKVILVGDIIYREKTITKIVTHNLTHRNNIIECYDIADAEAFLLGNVVSKGFEQHIDLIIVDDILEGSIFQKNLCDWIRTSDESYSSNNFRLSSIPIILYKKDVKINSTHNTFYNAVVPFSESYADNLLVSISRKVVKEWREEILSDFAVLQIELNNSKTIKKVLEYSISDHKMVARNYEYYFSITKIVSKQFIKLPKPLNYDWLSEQKLIAIETSLGQYDKIIRNLFKYNGKAFEKQVLHRFYNKYPFFLKKDIFKTQIYERRFYISSTSKFHVPDFILESPFPKHTYTSISEIKRHNIYFEFKPNQHKNFTNYTQNALNQASNYEDDFKNAGLFNGKIQMDLIIGLDDRLTEFVKRKTQKHFSTTNIITHNNVMTDVEEYYVRLKSSSI